MRYVPDSPLQLAHRVWPLKPPTFNLVVVVKGTFDLVEGERAVFAEEPIPPTGEVYFDDDPENSVQRPSDFALLKGRGECMVVGKAWATGGRPQTHLPCRFKVGDIDRQFAVFGDRRWDGGLLSQISEPESFTEMPLRLEKAYGGPGFGRNPLGTGRKEIEGERPLPNLEDPKKLIRSRSQKSDPVMVGPIPQSYQARSRYVGSYGGDYLETRWPWLPEDFDYRYFQEAPEDQQIEGYWRGDERIEVFGLHPSESILRSKLPAIHPRVFVQRALANQDTEFVEVALRLDTVVWDAELGKLLLTWRGLMEASESLEEVQYIFVADETHAQTPQSKEEHEARCAQILAEEDAEEDEAEGQEPPDSDDPVQAEAPSEPVPAESGLPAQTAEEEAPEEAEDDPMQALREQMAAAGVDPGVEPAPEPAQPLDGAALLAKMEASGAPIPPDLRQTLLELNEPEEPVSEPEPKLEEPEPDPLEGRALVVARLEAGEDLRALDLSHADLSGLDLGGQDLGESLLNGACFTDAKLRQANLRGANLAEAELGGVDMRASILADADLTEAKMQGVDLRYAFIEDADFSHATLRDAKLSEAIGSRALFSGADLQAANLEEAKLDESEFDGADLSGAKFDQATLSSAWMERALAKGASFDKAVMDGVRCEGIRAEGARFGSVVADESFWEKSQLDRADFSFSSLNGADFSDASLLATEFDGCHLVGARFERAKAEGLTARKANLMEANFESTDLSKADLRGANLYRAEFWRAKTDSTKLALANVKETKLDD